MARRGPAPNQGRHPAPGQTSRSSRVCATRPGGAACPRRSFAAGRRRRRALHHRRRNRPGRGARAAGLRPRSARAAMAGPKPGRLRPAEGKRGEGRRIRCDGRAGVNLLRRRPLRAGRSYPGALPAVSCQRPLASLLSSLRAALAAWQSRNRQRGAHSLDRRVAALLAMTQKRWVQRAAGVRRLAGATGAPGEHPQPLGCAAPGARCRSSSGRTEASALSSRGGGA